MRSNWHRHEKLMLEARFQSITDKRFQDFFFMYFDVVSNREQMIS